MIQNPQEMVRKFHEKFDLPRADYPDCGTLQERLARVMLVQEECDELMDALIVEEPVDLAHIAREMADVLYVIYGSAVSMGIDLEPVFEEVHRANMAKVGGVIDGRGKLGKPPHWKPPDVEGIIRKQMPGDRVQGSGYNEAGVRE